MTVRLFARASDLAGADRLMIALPLKSTVRDLRAALLKQHAALEPLANSLLAAVNADYAADDHVLSNGCEVAFFPPVSGG